MPAGHVAAVGQMKPQLIDAVEMQGRGAAGVVCVPGHGQSGEEFVYLRIFMRQPVSENTIAAVRGYKPVGGCSADINRNVAVCVTAPRKFWSIHGHLVWRRSHRHRVAQNRMAALCGICSDVVGKPRFVLPAVCSGMCRSSVYYEIVSSTSGNQRMPAGATAIDMLSRVPAAVQRRRMKAAGSRVTIYFFVLLLVLRASESGVFAMRHVFQWVGVLAVCWGVVPLPVAADVLPGDFYQMGHYAVDVRTIVRGIAPVRLAVYSPQDPGCYPLIVFLHGFTGAADAYQTILQHVASHGFIVVAPQMYRPGCMVCAPPPALEALRGVHVLRWIQCHLGRFITAQPDARCVGLAGHSRGGQIACRIAARVGDDAQALAGVDPVDAIEQFGQHRITTAPLPLQIPTLYLGTGLGPVLPDNATFPLACAPLELGHEAFYLASPAPCLHAVAVEYGHVDMVDEEDFTADACPGGPDRDAMRRFTAGALAAFFSGVLQDNPAAWSLFDAPDQAPVVCVAETK